jgi:hypothetical protein
MSKLLTPSAQLILLIILAFIVDYLPLINLPFLWSETFFHELSHGLVAILTGGTIVSITIDFDGSGLCVYSGGTKALVSFAGYAGSGIWGLLIYTSVGYLGKSKRNYITLSLMFLVLTVLILWGRDVSSIIIMLILAAMYLAILLKNELINLRLFMQFIGIFVMLDAIRSPLYLLDGKNAGDGAKLSQLTWLPEFIWILIWVATSALCLLMAWRYSKLQSE